MKHALILCAVFLISGALLVLNRGAAQRFLGLRVPSRFWVRLLGISGMIWVLLAVLVHERLGILDRSSDGFDLLRTVRHYVGGTCLGLIIALNTKQKEGMTHDKRREDKLGRR